jgi:hypothetical protein
MDLCGGDGMGSNGLGLRRAQSGIQMTGRSEQKIVKG